MRFFKITLGLIVLLASAYVGSMYYFVEESKSFTIEKEINYPIDKVFPQFNNFQNLTRWNNYFSSSKTIDIDFFTPYEGEGSNISYSDLKKKEKGEMFIRYENPNKTLKFQLFENNNENPTLINVKFTPISNNKTKIIWYVQTPKLPLWSRIQNFWTEDNFTENIDKSMVNLNTILGNKVEKDNILASIKYDSLMIEKEEARMILGVNVSTSNKKGALFKNIVMNNNKVYNYITMDLGKRNDEFGYMVLITHPNNYKDKEVSYFLGIPLSKKIGITDNNFSFRSIAPMNTYVMYYKGMYENRVKVIQNLVQKAKKDEMRFGDVYQTFIDEPKEDMPVNMKISLSVYK